MSKDELKPCPFCGRKMIFYKDEYKNKYGQKVVMQYYLHENKKAECVLDKICMPFSIGAGDATTDSYTGEYAKLWNLRTITPDIIDKISQELQNAGFEKASKWLNCKYEIKGELKDERNII